MKYVVIGAGGTGGCLGGFLAEHGHDVTLIARNRHLEEIRRNGLILKSCSLGERQIRSVKACTMEEYSDTPDVVFVCVKFYSLEETIPFLQRIASENTLVIPILNIFGTGGILERSCPAPVILDGCIYIYSMIEAPESLSSRGRFSVCSSDTAKDSLTAWKLWLPVWNRILRRQGSTRILRTRSRKKL